MKKAQGSLLPWNESMDASHGAAALLEGHMYRFSSGVSEGPGGQKVRGQERAPPTPQVFTRPMGDRTTVVDVADRDEMDDVLFPLDAKESWFSRDSERRTLTFANSVQEIVYKGTAKFGGYLVFEIGALQTCDILLGLTLQIRLGHWLPDYVQNALLKGAWKYEDPDMAWAYANSLGTALIARAEFLVDDQVLEVIEGEFANIASLTYPDINMQAGVGRDGLGRWPIPDLVSFPGDGIDKYPSLGLYPTSNGYISCVLPFSFQRIRLRNGFPLVSAKDGTLRVALTLRPFSECVRRLNGTRDSCVDTPLGKTFGFMNTNGTHVADIVASETIPDFRDCRLVTYGVLVDGKYRKALLRAPFDRLYRQVASFSFSEPQKYVVNTSSAYGGTLSLQLPLELNNPVEEIFWIVRRKGVSLNNEWTNYSSILESEYTSAQFTPFRGMLVRASLQVNGETLVEGSGDFFLRENAMNHRGGIVPYRQFVYGYTFATKPGSQDPSGWFNASRATDVRLRVEVSPPGGTEDLEFEVLVYAISMNWVRFENGIANKVFSS